MFVNPRTYQRRKIDVFKDTFVKEYSKRSKDICRRYGHSRNADIIVDTHCCVCYQKIDRITKNDKPETNPVKSNTSKRAKFKWVSVDETQQQKNKVKRDEQHNFVAKKEKATSQTGNNTHNVPTNSYYDSTKSAKAKTKRMSIEEMTKYDVSDWFRSINMNVHAERFFHNNYDGKKISNISRRDWDRLNNTIPFGDGFYAKLESLKNNGYGLMIGDKVYAKLDEEWKIGEIKHLGYGSFDYGIKLNNHPWIEGRNSDQIRIYDDYQEKKKKIVARSNKKSKKNKRKRSRFDESND